MTEKEFAEIVAGTKKAVLGAIRSSLHFELKDHIDDVAQETYIKIYKFIQKKGVRSLRPDSLSSWAYVIARNESIRMNDKYKSEIRKQNAMGEKILSVQKEPQAERPEIPFEKLSEPFRQTLRLFVNGLSHDEIARQLKVRPGTVRSRLNRAKQQLKQIVLEEA